MACVSENVGTDKGGGPQLEPGSQISVFLRGQIELRLN